MTELIDFRRSSQFVPVTMAVNLDKWSCSSLFALLIALAACSEVQFRTDLRRLRVIILQRLRVITLIHFHLDLQLLQGIKLRK